MLRLYHRRPRLFQYSALVVAYSINLVHSNPGPASQMWVGSEVKALGASWLACFCQRPQRTKFWSPSLDDVRMERTYIYTYPPICRVDGEQVIAGLSVCLSVCMYVCVWVSIYHHAHHLLHASWFRLGFGYYSCQSQGKKQREFEGNTTRVSGTCTRGCSSNPPIAR